MRMTAISRPTRNSKSSGENEGKSFARNRIDSFDSAFLLIFFFLYFHHFTFGIRFHTIIADNINNTITVTKLLNYERVSVPFRGRTIITVRAF